MSEILSVPFAAAAADVPGEFLRFLATKGSVAYVAVPPPTAEMVTDGEKKKAYFSVLKKANDRLSTGSRGVTRQKMAPKAGGKGEGWDAIASLIPNGDKGKLSRTTGQKYLLHLKATDALLALDPAMAKAAGVAEMTRNGEVGILAVQRTA